MKRTALVMMSAIAIAGCRIVIDPSNEELEALTTKFFRAAATADQTALDQLVMSEDEADQVLEQVVAEGHADLPINPRKQEIFDLDDLAAVKHQMKDLGELVSYSTDTEVPSLSLHFACKVAACIEHLHFVFEHGSGKWGIDSLVVARNNAPERAAWRRYVGDRQTLRKVPPALAAAVRSWSDSQAVRGGRD